ncbi:MAG: head decoration protein, partial [Desulfobacterales bacterium CG23_combo_of_CG06-09_8_20_14_all_52_9]
MTALTEANYLGDVLKFELDNNQSREQVTVLAGESLVMGEVVGKITKST